MADTKDVEKYYFDYLKKTEKFPQSVYHRAKHIEVSKIIGSLQRRSKILDAGCGIGNITGRYAKNHRIVGIDSQPEALKYAGAHYDGDYRQEDIYNINLPDNEFDLVLFLDAIEHFHRPVD